jgi:hypothetical protein
MHALIAAVRTSRTRIGVRGNATAPEPDLNQTDYPAQCLSARRVQTIFSFGSAHRLETAVVTR